MVRKATRVRKLGNLCPLLSVLKHTSFLQCYGTRRVCFFDSHEIVPKFFGSSF